MHQYLRHILCLLSFWALLPVDATCQQYLFRHYETENGLSNNTVNCTLQDRLGFIWIGTADGLNRFDGNSFKTFRKIKNNAHSLGNNFIDALHQDQSGRLWIGTHNGLFLYNRETESFKLIDFTYSRWVTSITSDRQGMLWFICSGDLYSYDVTYRSFKKHPIGYAYTVLCTTKDEIWTSDNAGNLLKYSKSGKVPLKYDIFKNSPHSITKEVEVLYQADENHVMIGASNQGLKLLNTLTGHYTDLITKNTDQSGIHVNDIVKTGADEFWAGTNSGVIICNLKKNNFINLKRNPLDAFSLSDDRVTSLTVDHERGVWIGTRDQGINYYNSRNNLFERYTPRIGVENLNTSLVKDISMDYSGNVWMATPSIGILKFNAATREFTRRHPAYKNVSALLVSDKELLIGRYIEGMDIVDIASGKLLHRFSKFYDADSSRNGTITCFYKTQNNNILIGTSRGLYTYNPRNKTVSRIKSLPENVYILSILEDLSGDIWIGSEFSGVYKIVNHGRSYERLNIDFSGNGIYNNTVTSIWQDKKNNIWFSSESDGVASYNLKTGQHTRYHVTDGLPSNNTLKILSDAEDNIWVSTAAGLCVINPAKGNTIVYNKTNGLISNQFCINSGLKAPDGRLYFGSTRGLVSFDPKIHRHKNDRFPLYITGVEVNNQELQPSSSEILNQSVLTSTGITLPYYFSNLTLKFSALSFTAPDAIRYEYKTEGLDTNWTDIKDQHKVYFSKLEPGEYRFSLRASNQQSGWCTTKTLNITVTPPWWKTIWAYSAYTLISVLGITGLFIYYHKQTTQRNNRKLEQLENRKDRELYKAKIDFFTNVAHEIRTPLTLITAPLERLTHTADIDDVKKNVGIIRRNTDRLASLTNQLLDFRRAENQDIRLSFLKTNINVLLHNIVSDYNSLAVSKQKQIDLKMPETAIEAFVDVEVFNQILHNIIGNAVKYASQHISVTLSGIDKDTLTIYVSNDGALIPVHLRNKIFEPFYRIQSSSAIEGTGIGLALALSLTKLHKGTLQLIDDNKTTIFRLTVPVHQDYEFDLKPYGEDDNILHEETTTSSQSPPVLLVEDNLDIARFLFDELKESYQVYSAKNGNEALTILETKKVDLIISDVMMPGMDGFQLCDLVKNNLDVSHIPFILLTANNQMEAKVKGLSLGADVYIEKPFSPAHIKAQIKSLLANRNRIKQHFSQSPVAGIQSIAVSKVDDEFLNKLHNAILNDLHNTNLNVDHLADSLYMTRRSLYRKIESVSNLTPNEMINVIRLKKAAEFLATADVKMYEVAERVGFKSRTSFTRSFIKQFGISPTEYLKQHQFN